MAARRKPAAAGPERLGSTLAPWRFLMFLALFAAATAALTRATGFAHALMLGFDAASIAFIGTLIPLFRAAGDHAAGMRRAAADNDANRALLLVITGAAMTAILVTVASELMGPGKADIPLVLVTLTLAWLFSNTVYALHYAHLYYSKEAGGDAKGIDFPRTPEPHYWDFVYFAFTLGMTFQTSDIAITDTKLRRVVVAHSFAAFLFNLGVIAFTINVLGSSR